MEDATLVLLGVFGALSCAMAFAHRDRRRGALERLAALLGGAATSNTATGHHDGVAITHRMAARSRGSVTDRWTEIECRIGGEPLLLDVRPTGARDAAERFAGRMIDLPVGDADFDAAFRVEGAPIDIVPRLFDLPIRDYLLAARGAEVTTEGDDHRTLRLAVRGWLEDPEGATKAWDVVVALRRNLRAAYASTVPAPAWVGAPFRGELDDSAARALDDRRRNDVAIVAAMRARRAAHQERAVRVLTIAAVVAFGIMVAVASAIGG